MKFFLTCLLVFAVIAIAAIYIKDLHTPVAKPPAYSLSDPNSIWVIVNKVRPLNPIQYAPNDLTDVGNGQQMRKEAATALKLMIDAAKAANYNVTPLSGYRSYQTQTMAYNSEVDGFGQHIADKESARPGYSEHQTGWAIDLGNGTCNLQTCFGDTAASKWLAANAYKYGFLVRYQAGWEDTTGYKAEPWHFRYVGTELSDAVHTKTVPLESYFDLPAAKDYKD